MLSFLIPVYPEEEKFSGLSHLFEHLLINHFNKNNKNLNLNMKGFVVEDHMFFFTGSESVSIAKVLEFINRAKINAKDFIEGKSSVLREIELYGRELNEKFYSLVWEGTNYKISPLGRKEELAKISLNVIKDYFSLIKRRPIYFFLDEKYYFINSHHNRIELDSIKLMNSRNISFLNYNFTILYFKIAGVLHLIREIMHLKNFKKIIKLSEKLDISALIIEKNSIFPEDIKEIIFLKQKAINSLRENLLKLDKLELVYNELLSYFYYGQNIQSRLKKILEFPEEELVAIIKFIKCKTNEN